ncbi:MAG: ABC transporter permease subunit [Lachnospiraceae bacterium]|nr:ABC transporter permease subunit [Lachnospiraceae bacterium]
MKKRSNPITIKDLMITSRSMKFSWGLFAYEAILMVVFLIALNIIGASGRYSSGGNARMFSRFVAMFPSVSIAELVMVALVIPVLTASAISGEKERQTFDILLTTEITPFRIVTGKLGSAVIQIMMFVVVSIPIMAMGFTIGGVSWWALLLYLALALVLAVFEGAIGIFCSSFCKKSITAIIMSYVFLAFFYGATFLPLIAGAIMDITLSSGTALDFLITFACLCLLFNPIVLFIEYYTFALSGESLMMKELLEEGLDHFDVLGESYIWLPLSVILILAVSFLFMKLAAHIINPLHAESKGRSAQGPVAKAQGASGQMMQVQNMPGEMVQELGAQGPVMQTQNMQNEQGAMMQAQGVQSAQGTVMQVQSAQGPVMQTQSAQSVQGQMIQTQSVQSAQESMIQTQSEDEISS